MRGFVFGVFITVGSSCGVTPRLTSVAASQLVTTSWLKIGCELLFCITSIKSKKSAAASADDRYFCFAFALRLGDFALILRFGQGQGQEKRRTTAFYASLLPEQATDELRMIQRQAFAGMLWNKQVYHFVVDEWLKKDPITGQIPRRSVQRNTDWIHLYNDDILLLPDKWEYPCFFAWDSAF